MTILFYLMSVFALMYEIMGLCNPKTFIAFSKSYKGKKCKEFTDSQKCLAWLTLFYFGWAFIGLFSSQWLSFVAIFVISVLPIKKIVIGKTIDSFLTVVVLGFIIINKYHLHLSAHDIIKSIFK